MGKIKSFFYFKGKLSVFRITLVLIFLLGLMLRIIGTNPGYPHTHPDESVVYATSINMVLNNTLNPFLFPTYKFQYPGLTIYLYAFLFKFVFIPISWGLRTLSDQSTVLSDIVGPGFINAMFWSRYITAFISFFSVPLVYLIGKKMFNKHVGLVSALFLTFNYRHVLSSHFGLLDAPNSTFALLTLYTALLLYEKQTIKNYLLAGVAIGLSLATKVHIFSMLPIVFVQFLLAIKKLQVVFFVQTFFSKKFIYSFLVAFALFAILNPYLFFYIPIAKRTVELYNLRIGLFYPPFEIIFPSFWYLYEIGFGKVMSILFLIGTFLFIKNRKRWINGIFLSFFIFLPGVILFYFSHGAAYVRYFASITPFAVIISAFAFWTLFEAFFQQLAKEKKYFFSFLIFLALLAGFDQIKNSLVLDYYAAKAWNSECITKWMDESIKDNSLIAVNNLVPRVDKAGVRYVDFDNTENHKSAFALARLQEKGIDYVVAGIEYLRGRFNWWVSSSKMHWGPPVDIFDNSFDGLVLKELSRYIVKACIKPWESPGNNFIAIKVPERKEPSGLTLVQAYDFKEEFGKIWQLSNPFHSKILEDVRVVKSSECKNSYCLEVEGKSDVPSREKIIISNLIPVIQREKYIAKVMIKSTAGIGSEARDGFLRIDYYDSDSADFTKRGINASVSPRYFAESSWKELTVSQVSPPGAKYLQVSFQAERYNATFLIDEVKVYSSNEKPSQEEIDASNKKEIDNNILYPLSLL